MMMTGSEILSAVRAGQYLLEEPDLNQLVQIFEAARSEAQPGDEFTADPAKWPVVRGITAVRDVMKAIRGD
jgi:hypothetical protein